MSLALADVAGAAPLNGITEIAGPERFRLADLVSQFLAAKGDDRKVVADDKATYFGSLIDDKSIVPLGDARLGKITFRQWFDKQALPA